MADTYKIVAVTLEEDLQGNIIGMAASPIGEAASIEEALAVATAAANGGNRGGEELREELFHHFLDSVEVRDVDGNLVASIAE